MSRKIDGDTILGNIINNYLNTEKSLVQYLNFKVQNHASTIGSFREKAWAGMFEQIIPKKYVIEQSVFLIDSDGNVSKEVDLAIFDEMYTPYIFHSGQIKFIPIEAVAAVIQCKSNELNNAILEEWCNSISKLNTSSEGVARMATSIIVPENNKISTQQATRPIMVLCHLGHVKGNNSSTYISNNLFDFELIADTDETNKIQILFNKDKSLYNWFCELNNKNIPQQSDDKNTKGHKDPKTLFFESSTGRKSLTDYYVGSEEDNVSLMSFNFQFNQLLMLINNPMLFPHLKYAEKFKDIYSKQLKKKVQK